MGTKIRLNRLRSKFPAKPASESPAKDFAKKILAGAISGTCSSAFAVPSDVLKVRMMADNTSDPNKRPKMAKIIRDIIKNDGIFGFYRGTIPAASRACVGAMSELAIYDDVKQGILKYVFIESTGSSIKVHVTAALVAGIVSCFVVLINFKINE